MFKAIGFFVIAVFAFMTFSAISFANDKSNSLRSHSNTKIHYNSHYNSHGSRHNKHLGQSHYSGNKGHGHHTQKHHVSHHNHHYNHNYAHHYTQYRPHYSHIKLHYYPYAGISNLFYGGYNAYDPHGSLHLGFVLR